MAMYCPQCLTQYRDGFSECADCHVALAPGSAPTHPAEGHAVELVTVLESSDPFVVNLAKSTLEDAGMEYVLAGDQPDERQLVMSPMGALDSRLQVAAAQAAEARDLLDPLLHPEPLPEDVEPV
jgi:hypothetical protein